MPNLWKSHQHQRQSNNSDRYHRNPAQYLDLCLHSTCSKIIHEVQSMWRQNEVEDNRVADNDQPADSED
jgi:hypothetical protein